MNKIEIPQELSTSAASRKDQFHQILLTIQRDNLSEVVACKTNDRSLYEFAKHYENKLMAAKDEKEISKLIIGFGDAIGLGDKIRAPQQ